MNSLLDRYDARTGPRQAYVLLDRESNICRVSTGARSLLAYSHEDVAGKPFRSFLSSDAYAAELKGLAYCVDAALRTPKDDVVQRFNDDVLEIRKQHLPANNISKFQRIIRDIEHQDIEKHVVELGSPKEADAPQLQLRKKYAGSIPAETLTLYKFPTEYGREYAGAELLLRRPASVLRSTFNKLKNALVEDAEHRVTNEFVLRVPLLETEKQMKQYVPALYGRPVNERFVIDFGLCRSAPPQHIEGIIELIKRPAMEKQLIVGNASGAIRQMLDAQAANVGIKSLAHHRLAYPPVRVPVLEGPEKFSELTAPEDIERYIIESIQQLEHADRVPDEGVQRVQNDSERKGDDVPTAGESAQQ